MNGQAQQYDFDLCVIGGGSGGLSCAKAAAKLGARVVCLDYVVPSPAGSVWGLGGTCVNVGCIPKKLMHTAGLLGEAFGDARSLGWVFTLHGHSWEAMVAAVQAHIRTLNDGYKAQLRSEGVTYINAHASFVSPHELLCTDAAGATAPLTAATFVLAVGARPRYLGVPGDVDCCITSDDLFGLPSSPGRTLVVGASYIALECAGFLLSLGLDVTLLARSIFLRGFDREMADHVGAHLSSSGARVIRPAEPIKFERDAASGRVRAHWRHTATGVTTSELFDTVLLAVGRAACTSGLGLESVGVAVDPATGKVTASDGGEATTAGHVYAIGDVLAGRQELTPVAARAGALLAARLFGGADARMDYSCVPTAVFTPLEYACVGLSEEEAVGRHGAGDVEVYIASTTPLEWRPNTLTASPGGARVREPGSVLFKVVTHLADGERVLGLHYAGPNAGEVIQGYAVAVKMGATKRDLDETIGIHPTAAEEFTSLAVTKRSGKTAVKTGC